MNKKDIAGIIYEYVVTGRAQADIAYDYNTDQWSGVSGTLQDYGFYDGTKGGYKKRFAKGYKGLTVYENMIYDYVREIGAGSDYYFEDYLDDNFDYYAKKQKIGKYASKPKTTTAKSSGGRATSTYQPTYTYTPPQKSAWEIQQEQAKAAREARYNNVIKAYNSQNWYSVVSYCDSYAFQNQMDTPELWFYYGYARNELGRYDQAVEAYRKYLNVTSDWKNLTITRSNIAYCLISAGKKQEALNELKFCQNYGYNVENLSARIRALEEDLNKTSTKEEAKRAYDAKNYERCYQLLRPLAGFSTVGAMLVCSPSNQLGDMAFELAYSAAELGHKKEAEGAYKAYISQNPHDPVGYNNRANIYREWEWYENERKDLEKAWSLGYRKNNIEARLNACRKAIAEKEEKKKEQAKFDGDMTYLDQCFEQKKYDLVCKTGDLWKNKDWDLGWHYFRYAYALAETGRDSDALAMYGVYIGKYPEDTAPRNNRANLLERAGRFKDALADLEKAYALGQRDFNIDTRIARLKQKIEDADVEAKMKKQFDADAEAAKIEFDASDYQGVVDRLEKWFDKNYDMGAALFRYAYALNELGDTDGSLMAYNRFLNKYTDSKAAYNNRAILWEKKGELDRALEDLEKAYELGERECNIDARLNRLRNAKEARKQAEERQKRWKEDCRMANAKMIVEDEPAVYIYNLFLPWDNDGQDLGEYEAMYAWAMGLTGRVDDAERRFEWMLSCNEYVNEVYKFRGRMYAYLWDKNKDEVDLDKALDDLNMVMNAVATDSKSKELFGRLRDEKDALVEERRLAEERRRAEEERKRQEEEEFLLLMM